MEEVKYYLIVVFVAALLISVQIMGGYESFGLAFKDALFQVASVISTTGFSTADFNSWPMFSKSLLLLVMISGGCAGATCGGLKISRVIILIRTVKKELVHLVHPRAVKKVRMDGEAVAEENVKSVLSFLVLYVLIVIGSFILVSLNNLDFETSITSVLTLVGNVGPGFGLIGPTGNFSVFNSFSKIVLIFDMLAGRLELMPLLVLFNIGTWRKS